MSNFIGVSYPSLYYPLLDSWVTFSALPEKEAVTKVAKDA
jgi:hypothetical protein